MDLAQPAFGELFDVDREDPRIGCGHAVDDGRGAVGGTIVDEDDFQIGVVLLQDRAQGRFERGGLIAGRNDDRELGPGLRRRRVGLRKHRHATNDAHRADEHPKPINAADECVSDENAVESHRPLERPCSRIATRISWEPRGSGRHRPYRTSAWGASPWSVFAGLGLGVSSWSRSIFGLFLGSVFAGSGLWGDPSRSLRRLPSLGDLGGRSGTTG